MLSNQTFYHGSLRNLIVAFGTLFSDIYIDRKSGNSVTGTQVQRLQIPISCSNKEKWIVRIDSDPKLENQTYTSLPRIAFEITGYEYDASRKLNRTNKITCGSGTNAVTYTYTPTPYNVNISLYVLTKNQEDAFQIIEQILPLFTPEYTLSVNSIPSMNIITDIPVILNNISVNDEYNGDFQTRRFVTHTLNFTLKANLFGAVSGGGSIITTVHANVGDNEDFSDPLRTFTSVGDVTDGTITSESWVDNI